MKLRNKKTEEIKTVRFPHYECGDDDKQYTLNIFDYEGNEYNYGTLAELNEEWEDYKPAEPLIKDEKIRKAVRAWAEANGYSLVIIGNDMASEPNYRNVQIHFENVDIVDEDKYGVHTIAELCGEEE